MKIYWNEIKDVEKELELDPDKGWLQDAVRRVDETPPLGPAAPAKRPISGDLTFRKVDEIAVVEGHIQTLIHLICSRCATPFLFPCAPHFTAMYSRDREMTEIWTKSPGAGFSAGADLEITYLDKDYLDLGETLSEQLRLLIPLQPLCREDCKGLCPECGADLNVRPCECQALKRSTLWAALQTHKAKAKRGD